MTIQIESEIGRLRTVLVHLPGREIDRMPPAMMQNLLFDDILHGARAREEHRRFQRLLRIVAPEVLEIQDLLGEVLTDPPAREAVLQGLARDLAWAPSLKELLAALPGDRLAAALIEGVDHPHPAITGSLDSLFLLPPVPNYFFQRDPAIAVDDRIIRGAMATPARLREPLLSGAVFEYHPRFGGDGGRFWFREFSADWSRNVSWARMRPRIEGGDLLVLRGDLIAIGYSERTEKTTIERLAEAFKAENASVRTMIVMAIPPERSYMHLDTVFTLVSEGEYLCYAPMILPGGPEEADVYSVDLSGREVVWKSERDLPSALRANGMDLRPISCGGSNPIDQQREQWTDGANAFALAPGVILCYDRNERTADELDRHGYEIVRDEDLLLGRRDVDLQKRGKHAILLGSSELTRARGGPRCMTMPLFRERTG